MTHTISLINQFNSEVINEFEQIENVELKIILALADLLEEPNEYEENFINKSLAYLKEHYGLNKSVWKVLLRLHSEVPDFIHKLSKWEHSTYIHYNGSDILNDFNETWYQIGFNDYKFFNSNREFNIFKFLKLINLMSQHFPVEQVTNYVGLFVKDFDNKKSSFSPHNLYEQDQQLKKNNAQDRIPNNSVNFFINTFSNLNNFNYNLRGLHFAGLDLKYRRFKNTNEFVASCLNHSFIRMNISHTNSLETYQSIMNSYHKYTNEELINCKGLLELRNHNLEEEDKKIFSLLFDKLDQSNVNNLVSYQTTICLLKLINNYENNVIAGLDKLRDLDDYLGKNINIPIVEKLFLENKLNLKTLLTFSHQWERQKSNKGQNKVFKNYDIDLQLGNYNFEQIKSSHRLHEEGKEQSHCVFNYKESCLAEDAIIISMKDLESNKISTIRFAKEYRPPSFFKKRKLGSWYLAENRKKFNKSCNKEEKLAANAYFELIKNKLN